MEVSEGVLAEAAVSVWHGKPEDPEFPVGHVMFLPGYPKRALLKVATHSGCPLA
jgi:hypothetical protein